MKRSRNNDVEILNVEDLWSEFGSPLPSEILKTNPSAVSQSPRWGARMVGVLLTVLLHSLLLTPLLLGTPSRKYQAPLTEGAAASAQNSEATAFVSTLLTFSDRSITDPEIQDDSAYDLAQQIVHTTPENDLAAALATISQPEMSGSPDSADQDSATAEAAGDQAGRAMLFGRYMQQIKARIERAWEYPSLRFKGKFQCKVQIAQGQHGDIKEVTLQRCNGDSTWQTSLVQAIQRASPLPAPPDQEVFSSVVTLGFEAESQALHSDAAIVLAPPAAASCSSSCSNGSH